MIPVHGTRISHLMHRDLNVMEAEPGPCAGLDGPSAGLNGPSAALDSVPGHAYP
jgi:hypothetical protein